MVLAVDVIAAAAAAAAEPVIDTFREFFLQICNFHLNAMNGGKKIKPAAVVTVPVVLVVLNLVDTGCVVIAMELDFVPVAP